MQSLGPPPPPPPPTFQQVLDNLRDFLDWNRWMMIGLVLWGLLVSVVTGSNTFSAVPVPCAGPNVMAGSMECTCDNKFPGFIWLCGWVLIAIITILEFSTDIFARHGIYVRKPSGWKEKTAGEILAGTVEENEFVELVQNEVQYIYRSSKSAMKTSVGLLNVDEQALISLETIINALEFNIPAESRFQLTKAAIEKLQESNQGAWPNAIQSLVKTAVSETCNHLNHRMRVRLFNAISAENASRKDDAPKEPINALAVYSATVREVAEDKVLMQVRDSIIATINTKININTQSLTNNEVYVWATLFYRFICNIFVFTTILLLTSFTWFPNEYKGCPVDTASTTTLAFVATAAVGLTGLRIFFCDLVDPSRSPK